MIKYLLLIGVFSMNQFALFSQTSFQTRTATYLNNLNNFQQVFGDQNYPRAKATDVGTDDNIYGCSSKLTAIKDSASSFMSNSVASLNLQGFGFSIPDNATIESLAIRIRRFKNGAPSVGDYFISLMQRVQCAPGVPCLYGVQWTNRDTYSGKIYPDTETEYVFSQAGSGNNGGYYHDQAYQWTPTIVNQTTFGLRIDNYQPIGRGSVQICYDLAEITVEYSVPLTIARRSSTAAETKVLKEPVVFPNPFTEKTNIQFTAAQSGKTVIELFNTNGLKVKTVYSENVLKGKLYNITVTDSQLPNGIYIYRISNDGQKYLGRIIKVE